MAVYIDVSYSRVSGVPHFIFRATPLSLGAYRYVSDL